MELPTIAPSAFSSRLFAFSALRPLPTITGKFVADCMVVTFPFTLEGLNRYDVVILSDLGSNTLLLPPDVWLHGKSVPNRLNLLREWVNSGGGLAMCGWYYSFAGIYAEAKYYRTPIEEILPVNIYTFDDRVERPEGVIPEVVLASHPIVQGMPSPWPYLLGFNELQLKPDATLIARASAYPLLAVRQVGKGRTLAWASDIGPHWCPEPFVNWPGYARFWKQAIEWLAGGEDKISPLLFPKGREGVKLVN
jgi:uncharacterized membrane protein